MADLSDIITVTVVVQNPGVTAAGFGVPLIVSHSATWAERVRSYANLSEVDDDFASTTPEYAAAQKIFQQEPTVPLIKIGRAALVPTQRYGISVFAVTLAAVYGLTIGYQNGTAQEASYTAAGATAWTITTAYAQGYLVENDTGKHYICTIAGTSAGAVGPTGTGSAIVDGTVTWMYAGAGAVGVANNDAIVYNLMLDVNAFATPVLAITNSLQGSVAAKTLRILANAAGAFYDVRILNPLLLTNSQDHADPGIATDLAAIATETDDWYGLITLFNSEALIAAAAAWVETDDKLYIAASCDTQIIQVVDGSATDIAHDIKASGYHRTHVIYSSKPGQFVDAALMGRVFPFDPGGVKFNQATLTGPTPDTFTSTHKTNLVAKFAGWFYIFGGLNIVGGAGKAGSGRSLDITRDLDWFAARLSERIANLIISRAPKKIPYTNNGIALIEAQMRAQVQDGERVGMISTDEPRTVFVPKAEDVDDADKAARELNDCTIGFTLSGGIDKVNVNVQANL
jgi:hypothetical protein